MYYIQHILKSALWASFARLALCIDALSGAYCLPARLAAVSCVES